MRKLLILIFLLSLPALAFAFGEEVNWLSSPFPGGWQPATFSATTDIDGNLYFGATNFMAVPFPAIIARWDGSNWTALPTPFPFTFPPNISGTVDSLYYDRLADVFVIYGTIDNTFSYLLYGKGASWFGMAAGARPLAAVNRITLGPDGKLYKSGQFVNISHLWRDSIQYWEAGSWHDLPSLDANTYNSFALMDIAFDEETGYLWAAGGDNFPPGGATARGFVKYFNGARWIDTNIHEIYTPSLGVIKNIAYDSVNKRMFVAGHRTFEDAGGVITAYHDAEGWHDIPVVDVVSSYEVGLQYDSCWQTMVFAVASASTNNIHVYAFDNEAEIWVDVNAPAMQGHVWGITHDPDFCELHVISYHVGLTVATLWHTESPPPQPPVLEEEEEAALNPCEVEGGIICPPRVQCSSGYFARASDSSRCCLEECLVLPDLIVPGVSVFDPLITQGSVLPIEVTVKNNGFADANAFTVTLTVQEPLTTLGSMEVDGLDVNEQITLEFNFNSAGFTDLLVLEAKADSLGAVAETEEKNNSGLLEVFVRLQEEDEEAPPIFVDLVVSDIDFSSENPIVGEEIVITVTVVNVGSDVSAPSSAGLYLGDVFEPLVAEMQIPSLAPAQTHQVTFRLQTLDLQEEVDVIVFVDHQRSIDERDEENNIQEETISVLGETVSVEFESTVMVGEEQVFAVSDADGAAVQGAMVEVILPFKDAPRKETLFTGEFGTVAYLVEEPGEFSFTVSKPGYYSVFGGFDVIGGLIEGEVPAPIVDPLFLAIILAIVAAYLMFKRVVVVFKTPAVKVSEQQFRITTRIVLAGIAFAIPVLVGMYVDPFLGEIVALIEIVGFQVLAYIIEAKEKSP